MSDRGVPMDKQLLERVVDARARALAFADPAGPRAPVGDEPGGRDTPELRMVKANRLSFVYIRGRLRCIMPRPFDEVPTRYRAWPWPGWQEVIGSPWRRMVEAQPEIQHVERDPGVTLLCTTDYFRGVDLVEAGPAIGRVDGAPAALLMLLALAARALVELHQHEPGYGGVLGPSRIRLGACVPQPLDGEASPPLLITRAFPTVEQDVLPRRRKWETSADARARDRARLAACFLLCAEPARQAQLLPLISATAKQGSGEVVRDALIERATDADAVARYLDDCAGEAVVELLRAALRVPAETLEAAWQAADAVRITREAQIFAEMIDLARVSPETLLVDEGGDEG